MREIADAICIDKDTTIRDTMRRLDKTAKKVLFVISEGKLIGSITDGDIRRWILKTGGGGLNEIVDKVMHKTPSFIFEKDVQKAKQKLREFMVDALPVIDANGKILEIILWEDKFEEIRTPIKHLKNPVVIMAGGEGTRLYPYTKILPKPLIPIDGLPITEHIINRFNTYGCDMFYLTVNYKKNMIKAYLDDIEKDYTVKYVEEERFLGTAGSLSLLHNEIVETFFMSNCDILIDGDYVDMLEYHKQSNAKITMVASLKHISLPYGIVNIDETGYANGISEKPEYNYLVNTGMYILEPETLEDIPRGTFFHITDLINYYVQVGKKVGIYPVSENDWLDMGQFAEMESMKERLNKES